MWDEERGGAGCGAIVKCWLIRAAEDLLVGLRLGAEGGHRQLHHWKKKNARYYESLLQLKTERDAREEALK